jgi:hypothetical protein
LYFEAGLKITVTGSYFLSRGGISPFDDITYKALNHIDSNIDDNWLKVWITACITGEDEA